MIKKTDLPEQLRDDIENKDIDLELSLSILNRYNAGGFDHIEPVKVSRLPGINGENIISLEQKGPRRFIKKTVEERLEHIGWKGSLQNFAQEDGDELVFSCRGLELLGISLFPFTAFGILNGGSATSYLDEKKNSSFNRELFSRCRKYFEKTSEQYYGVSKGLLPAFYQQNGEDGPSFLELKMRNILLRILQYSVYCETFSIPLEEEVLFPFFQMTSVKNNEEILRAYGIYSESSTIKELIEYTGTPITDAVTGIQPLITAYTHSREGRPKNLFTKAFGEVHSVLPLPGGHGQNFAVLKEIYSDLHTRGKRFAYLGNVDNLGFTINPGAIALLALTGREGGFEFSFKTPVDVKGGILVYDQKGRLNCADIGPAISKEDVDNEEKKGKKILFNCATGLFNLEYLTEFADTIIQDLPTRFSDQEKDAGFYSQAEQVTWEILGMMDESLIFGVEKYDRFLSAKIVLESYMTSGIGADEPGTDEALRAITGKLYRGLKNKLSRDFGMKEDKGKWIPKSAKELISEFRSFFQKGD